MDLTTYKLAAVEWLDSHYNTEECDREEITHRPWTYITTGILIRSDEVGVTLSTDLGEDGKLRGRNFVPRNMVVKEWIIGPLAKKVRKTKLKQPISPS